MRVSRVWTRVAMVLVGAWLFVAAFVMEPGGGTPTSQQFTNTWLSAAFAVFFGLLSLAVPRARLFNVAVGVWLVVSTFAFPTPGELIWNNVICGVLLAALALVREREWHPGPFAHRHRVRA